MNGHVYWKDKYTLINPIPDGAIPQRIDTDVADVIRQYFNAKYGEGEIRRFYVLQEKTEDAKWAYYDGTVMEILEEYFTYIEPDTMFLEEEI